MRLEDTEKWARRVEGKNPFVAEQDGTIVGFAELTSNGRISAIYSHHRWQTKGVGGALYKALEVEALRLKLDTLQVESSISASGFFIRMGFHVVEDILNLTDGIRSKSLLLEKKLST